MDANVAHLESFPSSPGYVCTRFNENTGNDPYAKVGTYPHMHTDGVSSHPLATVTPSTIITSGSPSQHSDLKEHTVPCPNALQYVVCSFSKSSSCLHMAAERTIENKNTMNEQLTRNCPIDPLLRVRSLVQTSPSPRSNDMPTGTEKMIDLIIIIIIIIIIIMPEPEMTLPSDALPPSACTNADELVNFMASHNCLKFCGSGGQSAPKFFFGFVALRINCFSRRGAHPGLTRAYLGFSQVSPGFHPGQSSQLFQKCAKLSFCNF